MRIARLFSVFGGKTSQVVVQVNIWQVRNAFQVVIKVHIDVGRFCLAVHAYLGKKSFEEQSMPNRVHSGDCESIGDGRVRGGGEIVFEVGAR